MIVDIGPQLTSHMNSVRSGDNAKDSLRRAYLTRRCSSRPTTNGDLDYPLTESV